MQNNDITYSEAVRKTLLYTMNNNPNIYIMGLGVCDKAGIFGSTNGLDKSFPDRVIEPPVSEAAFTGAAIGSALLGMRPVLIYQRFEFALLAMDQIINHASKIRYMSGGKQKCPVVIRIIVGKGWGNGAQHSQSLQAMLAHIPGLRVVMPSCPLTGQGLLMNALKNDDPTVIIEHRDVFKTQSSIPVVPVEISLKPILVNQGEDATVVAVSAMVEVAKARYPQADIFDLVSLAPGPDLSEIKKSHNKTKKLIVMDTGWENFGVSDFIISKLKGDDVTKISLPNCPTPTSVELEKLYYQNYDKDFQGPF